MDTPVRPRRVEIPEGFVDAWGLDEESIPLTPFIVVPKQDPDPSLPAETEE